MFNKSLLAEIGKRAKSPANPTPDARRLAYARMVAESHRLEGIETSAEAVLDATIPVKVPKKHAVAS